MTAFGDELSFFCSKITVLSLFLSQNTANYHILAFSNQQSLPHEDPFCAPKPLQSKWFVGAPSTMFGGFGKNGHCGQTTVLIGGFVPNSSLLHLVRPNFLTQPQHSIASQSVANGWIL
jgi:hypothetical protein